MMVGRIMGKLEQTGAAIPHHPPFHRLMILPPHNALCGIIRAFSLSNGP